MVLTLLSSLFGGLLRLAPEVLSLLNKQTDNAHELRMMDKQLELGRQKAADDRALAGLQGDINQQLAELAAVQELGKAQMQVTKIRWVDALNFSFRPISSYYFLGLYGVVKAAMIWLAVANTGSWTAVAGCWGEKDTAVLAEIISFWYVGRVFDKSQR